MRQRLSLLWGIIAVLAAAVLVYGPAELARRADRPGRAGELPHPAAAGLAASCSTRSTPIGSARAGSPARARALAVRAFAGTAVLPERVDLLYVPDLRVPVGAGRRPLVAKAKLVWRVSGQTRPGGRVLTVGLLDFTTGRLTYRVGAAAVSSHQQIALAVLAVRARRDRRRRPGDAADGVARCWRTCPVADQAVFATRYRLLRRTSEARDRARRRSSSCCGRSTQTRSAAQTVLASSAVLGLVVGFAARSTLANFVAGVMIAINQPVRLGDRVSVGDAEGTVEDIGLAYTRLRTPDNRRVLIPNEELANSRVTNMTIIDPVSLAQVRLTLPPTADPARVRAILDEQAEAVDGRLLERPGPGTAVAEVTADGTIYTVGVWMPDAAQAARGRLGAARALHHPPARGGHGRRRRDRGDDAVNGPVPPPRSAYDDVLGHVAARRRKRRADERRRGRRSLAATALVVVAIVHRRRSLVAGGVGATVAVSNVLKGVDLKTMKPNYPGVTTKIYDRHGKLLAQIPSLQNRTPVPFNQISKWLKIATVDIEDKRFYEHGGVDYQGIARAFLDDLKAGHVVQGASTIEQQLVRNLYLTDSQTFERKIKEAWLAIQMAEHWSKDKILGTYLNVIPYGGVTYGCEAAAETYFNEHCSQLNIRQAALIAGLPQSPTLYNPRLHPGGRPGAPQRGAAGDARPGPHHARPVPARGLARAGAAGAEALHPRPPAVLRPVRARPAARAVRQPGAAQRRAQGHDDHRPGAADRGARSDGVGAQLPRTIPPAALVAIDPRTGEILAMQSSTDYSQSKYNLAVQSRRQAGSTFKSYGLLAAMVDDHIDPNTTQYSTTPLVELPALPRRRAPRTTSGRCRTPSRPARLCCRSRPRSSSR